MTTRIAELMSAPAVTARPDEHLDTAARRMAAAGIGSLLVTDGRTPLGIVTERDLLRAAAADADVRAELVGDWMTAHPDVLGPETPADAARRTLAAGGYRHIPVVDGDVAVGMLSIRDLVGADASSTSGPERLVAPPGLEGVVVAATAVGDVRGAEGFFHYRQYAATDLALACSFEEVWALVLDGALPGATALDRFRRGAATHRALPEPVAAVVGSLRTCPPMAVLETAVTALGPALGWGPSFDGSADELRRQCVAAAAVVPTVVAAAFRLGRGLAPVPPRPDLGHVANYLWMLTGAVPDPDTVRALEQYLVLTVDHGFNASTFSARVVCSTGAGLSSALGAGVAALSGPLHGGSPALVLEMLDDIGEPQRARAWVEEAVGAGRRIMGFGHRVYRTEDPRAAHLKALAAAMGAPRVELARAVERAALDVLAARPTRNVLATNVEFWAAVVLEACGLDRRVFTPTFAVARTVGWTAHVLEQAAGNRIYRPLSDYVGPAAPVPVPPLSARPSP